MFFKVRSENMPNRFLSNINLRNLLLNATRKERLQLTQILDNTRTSPYGYVTLQREICECGGHSVTNFFRGQGTGYIDIVDDVANKLKIKGLTPYYSSDINKITLSKIDEKKNLALPWYEAKKRGEAYLREAEDKILIKILEQTYENMSPSERLEFDKLINEVANDFGENPSKKLAGTAGLMAIANMGGFATYTLLTTTMSAISMGTLGFGAYTTATTALSVAIGPVGWAGLGLAGVYTLGKPKYKKIIPLVATIAMIRQRIEYENK